VLGKYHLFDFNQSFWNLETLHCFGILAENLDETNHLKRKGPILLGRSQIISEEKNPFRKEPVISMNT